MIIVMKNNYTSNYYILNMVSKTREEWKVEQGVFDNTTIDALYRLYPKYFDRLRFVISTGKEADVYLAEKGEGKVAIKMYRMKARLYRDIYKYIHGDPRFEHVKNRMRDVIFAWARKEFKNLERARKAGLRVPKPITVEKNALVMEFIGKNDMPAPTANKLPPKDPITWRKTVYKWVRDLWNKANLVHGDLNKFNLMNYEEKPVVIDISQAVLKEHPLSKELLERDVRIISNWFNKLGADDGSLKKWYKKVINK
jgi:RIO kinase 1